MSRTGFIKLTSMVINQAHIVEITKYPTQYNIYMSNNMIGGVMAFGSGSLNSMYNKIEICSAKQPDDYKKITEWIDALE